MGRSAPPATHQRDDKEVPHPRPLHRRAERFQDPVLAVLGDEILVGHRHQHLPARRPRHPPQHLPQRFVPRRRQPQIPSAAWRCSAARQSPPGGGVGSVGALGGARQAPASRAYLLPRPRPRPRLRPLPGLPGTRPRRCSGRGRRTRPTGSRPPSRAPSPAARPPPPAPARTPPRPRGGAAAACSRRHPAGPLRRAGGPPCKPCEPPAKLFQFQRAGGAEARNQSRKEVHRSTGTSGELL